MLYVRCYMLDVECLRPSLLCHSCVSITAFQMKDGTKIIQKSVMCSFNGENFCKDNIKTYFCVPLKVIFFAKIISKRF